MSKEISKFLIYNTPNNEVRVDVYLEEDTVWLTQKSMAEMFQTTPQNITIHLKNIYESEELQENATCKDFLQVRKEGERTVSSYFDYIEGLIERENTFTMQQLAESVNKFLSFNEYRILEGKGHISKIQAARKAVSEYNEFNKTQKIISDFDKQIKKMKE